MFQSLTQKFSNILSRIQGRGALSEKNIQATLQEVEHALLDSDVAFAGVEPLIKEIKERALGEKVLEALSPGEQFIKIVHDILVEKLQNPPQSESWNFQSHKPLRCMVVGLQGSGKTTMCGKLGWQFKNLKKKVLLASIDVYRPGAKEQLEGLGAKAGLDTLPIVPGESPRNTVRRLLQVEKDYDGVILDTAGRLQIQTDLMEELIQIHHDFAPQETLFVGDMMVGQALVEVLRGFSQAVALTGCCFSRADSDSRGGGLLSVRLLFPRLPIKLLGTGETFKDASSFEGDRIARRILDMGDILALAEKAQSSLEEEEMKVQADRLKKGVFTLNDFKKQLGYLEKLGGLKNILGFLPGFGKIKAKLDQKSELLQGLQSYPIIMDSMTPKERAFPEILDGSRKARIARGSGQKIASVNQLLDNFKTLSSLMKQMGGRSFPGSLGGGMATSLEAGSASVSKPRKKKPKPPRKRK